jgi:hypothetical protein
MKVEIIWDRDVRGWRYFADGMSSNPQPSYPAIVRSARSAGHTINNLGWKHRMLATSWDNHALDRFPEWELELEGAPAFAKLEHVHREDEIESSKLAEAWDAVAAVDFYKRDWTESGTPTVSKGETYWSGWWFQTVAERDRFLAWHRAR